MHTWVGFPHADKGQFHASTSLPTPSPIPPLSPLSRHCTVVLQDSFVKLCLTTWIIECSRCITISARHCKLYQSECSRCMTISDRHCKLHWRFLIEIVNWIQDMRVFCVFFWGGGLKNAYNITLPQSLKVFNNGGTERSWKKKAGVTSQSYNTRVQSLDGVQTVSTFLKNTSLERHFILFVVPGEHLTKVRGPVDRIFSGCMSRTGLLFFSNSENQKPSARSQCSGCSDKSWEDMFLFEAQDKLTLSLMCVFLTNWKD
jgi:hypothetical protein